MPTCNAKVGHPIIIEQMQARKDGKPKMSVVEGVIEETLEVSVYQEEGRSEHKTYRKTDKEDGNLKLLDGETLEIAISRKIGRFESENLPKFKKRNFGSRSPNKKWEEKIEGENSKEGIICLEDGKLKEEKIHTESAVQEIKKFQFKSPRMRKKTR